MGQLPARMNLNFLRTFESVARHCSFTRAAVELGRSQATLSAQIHALEHQLGLRLLHRTTRRVILTDAGRALWEAIDNGFRDIAAGLSAARELLNDRRGRIIVACVPSLSGARFPSILAAYRSRDSVTRIDVEELTSSEILVALEETRVDLGIGPCTTPPPPTIAFAAAVEEPLCVVLPSNNPLRTSGIITLEALASVPLITLSGSVLLQTYLETVMQVHGLQLSSQTEVRHVQTAVAMVRAGVGAAVVPRLALPDVLDPNIFILPIGDPPLVRTIGVLTRRGQPLELVAARFARHVRSDLIRAVATVAGTARSAICRDESNRLEISS